MAFTYCHKCGEGQDAPTIDDFAYSGLNCQSCGVKRDVRDDWFAMAVADMRDSLVERLEALEAKEQCVQAIEAATPLTEGSVALSARRFGKSTFVDAMVSRDRLIPIRGDEEPRARLPRVPAPGAALVQWFAIEDVKPPEREHLMVTGESGYGRPYIALAYYDEAYRSSRGGPLRWLDMTNTELTDYVGTPTHWAHRINLPGDAR